MRLTYLNERNWKRMWDDTERRRKTWLKESDEGVKLERSEQTEKGGREPDETAPKLFNKFRQNGHQ